MELAVDCYELSSDLPPEEKFGFASQIRRSATSVPANIAEGFGRWSPRDFARFLSIASGSLRELEAHLLVAARLQYLPPDSLSHVLESISATAAKLYRLRQKVVAERREIRTLAGSSEAKISLRLVSDR